MNCPDCHQALARVRVRDAVLDRCARCGGLWFDEDEIAIYRVPPVTVAGAAPGGTGGAGWVLGESLFDILTLIF